MEIQKKENDKTRWLMLASGHQGVKGTVSDGTGCHQQQFKAQRRRGPNIKTEKSTKNISTRQRVSVEFSVMGFKRPNTALVLYQSLPIPHTPQKQR